MKNILIIFSLLLFIVGCTTSVNKTMDEESLVCDDGSVCLDDNEFVPEGSYMLNTEESVMKWHSEKIVGNKHTGIINLIEGNVDFTAGTGMFIIDMNSMKEIDGSGVVINHLKSEDFFNVEKFPTSIIEIMSINNNIVTGDLTILNKTNEISFPAQFMKQDGKLYARADFTIDRTLWGIKYGSGKFFQDLGDKAIKDDIKFNLELVFN